jgi:ABC-type polar amino acid transport system ATPase subunit
MLSGIGLKKSYSDGSGIQGISISITPGNATVVMGPSGSGKTTLLRVLALLEQPEEGILELDGKVKRFPSVKPVTYSWPYPYINLVFQQLYLWPHLTNRKNLELPLKSSSQHKRLGEIIKKLEISPFLDKYPNESSLGQRQRVAIVRALALQPRYLLLDEVTSALDLASTARVSELLKEELSQGLGAMIITHDRGFAKIIGGTCLWMENGHLTGMKHKLN